MTEDLISAGNIVKMTLNKVELGFLLVSVQSMDIPTKLVNASGTF